MPGSARGGGGGEGGGGEGCCRQRRESGDGVHRLMSTCPRARRHVSLHGRGRVEGASATDARAAPHNGARRHARPSTGAGGGSRHTRSRCVPLALPRQPQRDATQCHRSHWPAGWSTDRHRRGEGHMEARGGSEKQGRAGGGIGPRRDAGQRRQGTHQETAVRGGGGGGGEGTTGRQFVPERSLRVFSARGPGGGRQLSWVDPGGGGGGGGAVTLWPLASGRCPLPARTARSRSLSAGAEFGACCASGLSPVARCARQRGTAIGKCCLMVWVI